MSIKDEMASQFPADGKVFSGQIMKLVVPAQYVDWGRQIQFQDVESGQVKSRVSMSIRNRAVSIIMGVPPAVGKPYQLYILYATSEEDAEPVQLANLLVLDQTYSQIALADAKVSSVVRPGQQIEFAVRVHPDAEVYAGMLTTSIMEAEDFDITTLVDETLAKVTPDTDTGFARVTLTVPYPPEGDGVCLAYVRGSNGDYRVNGRSGLFTYAHPA